MNVPSLLFVHEERMKSGYCQKDIWPDKNFALITAWDSWAFGRQLTQAHLNVAVIVCVPICSGHFYGQLR